MSEYKLTFADTEAYANDFQDIQSVITEIIIESPSKFFRGDEFTLFTDDTRYNFNAYTDDGPFTIETNSQVSIKDLHLNKDCSWSMFEVNNDLTRIEFLNVKYNINIVININYNKIFK